MTTPKQRTAKEIEFVSGLVEEKFFGEYAELFAHFNVKSFMESLSSYLQLNYTAEELQAAPVTPGAYRKLLALATITLFNRGAVNPLTDSFNQAAESDLNRLRQETGTDLELVPPPPPKAPTAEETLRQQVADDWRTLSMDKIRAKKNADRRYSIILEKMANEGALDSAVTSIQRLGQ
jgi:hypothetical protein